MKIIIRNASAETARVDFRGNSFSVTRQAAIVESEDGELRAPITLNLPNGAEPYPVGEYRLGDKSFVVDGRYKRLEFARELELIPIKSAELRKAS